MPSRRKKVCVLGGGIIGATSALRLLQSYPGHLELTLAIFVTGDHPGERPGGAQ